MLHNLDNYDSLLPSFANYRYKGEPPESLGHWLPALFAYFFHIVFIGSFSGCSRDRWHCHCHGDLYGQDVGGTERRWQHLRHQAGLCRSGHFFSHGCPRCTCFNRKLPVFARMCAGMLFWWFQLNLCIQSMQWMWHMQNTSIHCWHRPSWVQLKLRLHRCMQLRKRTNAQSWASNAKLVDV